jgi:phosphatidylglycerol:prolipoprotein diacylglycerol transferase
VAHRADDLPAGIYLIVAAWRAGSRNQQGKSVKSEPAIMPKIELQ